MKDRDWLLRDKYNGTKSPAFKRDCLRIESGEPVDYVIGWKPFLGCIIGLEHRPLIPRPETEYWTEQVIKELRKRPSSQPVRCLDLCSGSGCIAVAILRHLHNTFVDCVDITENSIASVEENAQRNHIAPSRLRIFKSDLFEKVTGRYDCITANPPYIALERSPEVASSVKAWEPNEALYAENQGLAYIENILKEGRAHLRKNGTLYIEFDSWQKSHVERLAKRYGYANISFLRDQYGMWRTIVLHNATP